jgi:4-alpha-glucanotransferase
LRGWWEGSDIELKERLHLYPKADEAARQLAQRKQDRTALLALLREQELLNAEDAEVTVEDVVRAVDGILARSAALMAIAQLDDITGEAEQVNVPSTSHDKHPNWRRRLSIALEDLPEHPPMQAIADLFNRERRRASIQGTQPQQRGS